MNQNTQLTAKQNKLSSAILTAGNLSGLTFAKEVLGFRKIKQIPVEDVGVGLGIVFTGAANLLGIKNGFEAINKADIKEMILHKYANLSLEEINYAFKLDRWSGEPVDHFQLFNSEYVAKVLEKYKAWLRETRITNNLPLAPKQELPEITEAEKEAIVKKGIEDCFIEFCLTQNIPDGKSYVYDYLFPKKVFPSHTKRFKEHIKRKAIKSIYKKRKSGNVALKSVLKDIQAGNNKVQTECKRIILKTFFVKLIKTNQNIRDFL